MDDDDDFDILLQLAEQVEAAEGEDVDAEVDHRLPLLLQRQAQDEDMRLERTYGREALRQALGPGPCSGREAGGESMHASPSCTVHCALHEHALALGTLQQQVCVCSQAYAERINCKGFLNVVSLHAASRSPPLCNRARALQRQQHCRWGRCSSRLARPWQQRQRRRRWYSWNSCRQWWQRCCSCRQWWCQW